MSLLYITEYSVPEEFFSAIAPREVPVAEQVLTIGGVSVQSSPFNITTNMIRLHSDVTCAVAVGANPTAQAVLGTLAPAPGSARLAAGNDRYLSVKQGQSWLAAVIAAV